MNFDFRGFTARLKTARQRSGKSDQEIAEVCGLEEKRWNFILKGIAAPSAHEIFKLCVCLDVGADWLLGIKALRESEG